MCLMYLFKQHYHRIKKICMKTYKFLSNQFCCCYMQGYFRKFVLPTDMLNSIYHQKYAYIGQRLFIRTQIQRQNSESGAMAISLDFRSPFSLFAHAFWVYLIMFEYKKSLYSPTNSFLQCLQ